jgi:hypothetical protein
MVPREWRVSAILVYCRLYDTISIYAWAVDTVVEEDAKVFEGKRYV